MNLNLVGSQPVNESESLRRSNKLLAVSNALVFVFTLQLRGKMEIPF